MGIKHKPLKHIDKPKDAKTFSKNTKFITTEKEWRKSRAEDLKKYRKTASKEIKKWRKDNK